MEFHQLQGRFDLAPVDPQTQRRTFPFERNDDLKSLATKYELMNPEKQAAHAKKAKKLRQKVQRFKTTKTEVLKVLTENGDIQPNISRYSGPGDTAIYEPMGRRPDMPIALDGKEKAVFQSLKSEFDENNRALQDLRDRVAQLAGGKHRLRSKKVQTPIPSFEREATGEMGLPSSPTIPRHKCLSILPHDGAPLELGSKVQVFCEVAKSMGHIKHNFVRGGKVVYFDKGLPPKLQHGKEESDVTLLDKSEYKGRCQHCTRMMVPGKRKNGPDGPGTICTTCNKIWEEHGKLPKQGFRWFEEDVNPESNDRRRFYRMMIMCIEDDHMTSKYPRRSRMYDNGYGVLYEDNEIEFGVARARITFKESRSLRLSIEFERKRKEKEAFYESSNAPVHDENHMLRVKHGDKHVKIMAHREKKRKDKKLEFEERMAEIKKAREKEEEKRRKKEMKEKQKKLDEEKVIRDKKQKDSEDWFKKVKKQIEKKRADDGVDPRASSEEIKAMAQAQVRKKREAKKKVTAAKRKKQEEKMRIREEKITARIKEETKALKDKHLAKKTKQKIYLQKEKSRAERIKKKNVDRESAKKSAQHQHGIAREGETDEAKRKHKESIVRMLNDAQTSLAVHRKHCQERLTEVKACATKVNALSEEIKDNRENQKPFKKKRTAKIAWRKSIEWLEIDIEELEIEMCDFRDISGFGFFCETFHDHMLEIIEAEEKRDPRSGKRRAPSWKNKVMVERLEDLWSEMDSPNVKVKKRLQKTLGLHKLPNGKKDFFTKETIPEETTKEISLKDMYEHAENVLKLCKECADEAKIELEKEEDVLKAVDEKTFLTKDRVVKNIFDLIDHDKDGKLNSEELLEGMKSKDIMKEFKKSCQLKIVPAVLKELTQFTQEDHEIMDTTFFDDIDLDGDRMVKPKEFSAFIEKQNLEELVDVCKVVFEELESDSKTILFSDFEINMKKNKLINKRLLESEAVKYVLGATVVSTATQEIRRRGILDDEGTLNKPEFLVFLSIVQEHVDKNYVVYYDNYMDGKLAEGRYKKMCTEVFKRFPNQVVEKDVCISFALFRSVVSGSENMWRDIETEYSINQVHECLAADESGKHCLRQTVFEAAALETEESLVDHNDQPHISKASFIKFLKDVWAIAMMLRIGRTIYSVAQNIKDWERFKTIVEHKERKEKAEREHKEKTPEMEDDSEEKMELLRQDLDRKQKENAKELRIKQNAEARKRGKEKRASHSAKQKLETVKKLSKVIPSKSDMKAAAFHAAAGGKYKKK